MFRTLDQANAASCLVDTHRKPLRYRRRYHDLRFLDALQQYRDIPDPCGCPQHPATSQPGIGAGMDVDTRLVCCGTFNKFRGARVCAKVLDWRVAGAGATGWLCCTEFWP